MNFKVGDIIRRDVDTWLGSFEILDIQLCPILEENYVNVRCRETNDEFDHIKLDMIPAWILYTPMKPTRKHISHRMTDLLTPFGE